MKVCLECPTFAFNTLKQTDHLKMKKQHNHLTTCMLFNKTMADQTLYSDNSHPTKCIQMRSKLNQ